jgi:hypothetical protein
MKYNPPKLMQIRYQSNMGIKLDLKNPRNLDEKINYMSFYTDTSLWSEMADKVKVRDYVIKCGFPEILNQIYGIYNSPDEIDYNALPDKFVLKTNHASATNIFIKDKNKISTNDIKKKLNKWLKIDYGYKTATPHYSRIAPKVIAEKYLLENNGYERSLTDYKIYCFHGIPQYIFIFSDRIPNTHVYSKMIYDANWQAHPEYIRKGLKIAQVRPKPKSFEKMIGIAKELSKPFSFVRVDLYEIDGEPIFSELTFTPGHNSAANSQFLLEMGEMIHLSK